MSQKSKREYLRAIYPRYRKATIAAKSQILDEFCKICGYNRKYVLRLLNRRGRRGQGSKGSPISRHPLAGRSRSTDLPVKRIFFFPLFFFSHSP